MYDRRSVFPRINLKFVYLPDNETQLSLGSTESGVSFSFAEMY